MIIERNIPIKFKIDETTETHNWWISYDTWETYVFKCVNRFLDRTKNFVDMGAWNGAVSLYASNLCKNIYAFEPDEIAYSDLLKNIEINQYNNIIPIKIAVSNEKTQKNLYTNDEYGNSGSTLFNIGGPGLMQVNSDTFENLINDYNIKDVGLIKIDTEGSEKFIMPSIKEYLLEHKTPVHLSLHWMYLDENDVRNIIEPLLSVYKINDAWSQERTIDEIIEYEHGELLLF